MPTDLAQRKGRIERQGNQNPLVHVYRYVTEGTFDAYLWQTVENKQKFISQIMTSKSPVRSCDDVDETALSYAEIKALCAGNPLIKEKMDLDIDVARLRLLKSDHQNRQFRLEDQLLKHFPEQTRQNEGFTAGFKADMETLAAHPHPMISKAAETPPPADGEQPTAPDAPAPEDKPAAVEVKRGFAGMVVKGETFTEKDKAGAALIEAYKGVVSTEPQEIGSYRGFTMFLSVEDFGRDYILTLRGQMSHRVKLGRDALGNFVRIDNVLSEMPQRLAAVQSQSENIQRQMKEARAELGKPFPQEAELQAKSARLAALDAALNIDSSHSQGEQAIAKSARPPRCWTA